MKKLLIALLLVLLLFANAEAWKSSNEIADITYLLRCWPTGLSVANQSYTNGQVIDTAAEGCLDGSLTVVDTSTGSLSSVVGNKLSVLGSGTGSWGETGAVAPIVARTLGLAYFSKISKNTIEYNLGTNSGPRLSLNTNNDCGNANTLYSCVLGNGANPSTYYGINSSGTFSATTDYSNVIVLGGYDSNGVPYKTGDTKTNFTYGASSYIKGGSEWAAWTLTGRSSSSNANLYPNLSTYGTEGAIFSNLLIPNYDFSAVLQPIFLDTFTGVDGTSLADHTPDVGGAWTVNSGTWTIQSNKLELNEIASGHIAFIDSGISDIYLQVNSVSNDWRGGVVFRYTDTNNYYYAYSGFSAGYIRSVESGVDVSRASSLSSGAASFSMIVITSGNTIKYYTTAGGPLSYTSSFNASATKHGLYSVVDTQKDKFDNFAVWPLTSATYTSEFAKVGY